MFLTFRLQVGLMWHNMREEIIGIFPNPPKISINNVAYILNMEEIYTTDAYHSLSIEKYRVTPQLIERVKTGAWNTKENEADKKQKDAMAARGYWQAFNAVKKSIQRILKGENAGNVVDEEHGDWYRELFAPSVAVGLLKPSDLAGYRNNQVYIGQSKHTPINKDGVRDVMPLLFELLKREKHAGVRAVMGHFIFVYIHPYMDGNGRIGRFLMNTMLASGGYPWTVIPVETREQYMQALEAASVDLDIIPFAKLLGWLVEEGMKGTPVAKI
jgi:Fic family protein